MKAVPHAAKNLFALPLEVPRTTHYALLGIAPEATADEVRAASARYVARLKAQGADEAAITEANGLDLDNSESRAAHDARHPPLPLLRLEPTWDPVFDDRATCLAALRRELEGLLRSTGDPVHHPNDLTRAEFTADFTPTPLLDT